MKIWIFITLTCFSMASWASTSPAGDPPVVDYSAIANSDNPYDFIGQYHNEGLDAVASSGAFPCMDPVDRYLAYVRFLQQRYPEITYSYEAMGQLFDEVTDMAALSPEKAVKRLVSTGRISSDMSGHLQSIYQALFDHGSQEHTPEMLAAAIIRIENELIAKYNPEFDQPREEGELALVLANAAITRYSYAYWYAVEKDPKNGWNVILDGGCGTTDPVAERGGRFWKKLKQAWTDTVAFFTSDCDYSLIVELVCRLSSAGSASASCCK